MTTLEDFERSLAEEHQATDGGRSAEGNEKSGQTHRHHHHHHHKRKHHHAGEEREHGHKLSRRSGHEKSRHLHGETSEPQNHSGLGQKDVEGSEEQPAEALQTENRPIRSPTRSREGGVLKRDSWMEAPSALEIEFIQKRDSKPPQPPPSKSLKADFDLKIHEKELNQHHMEDLAEGRDIPEEVREGSMQYVVDYTFGDAGAQWRMTKLKNVHRQAEETGRPVDDVANDVYGSLRSFDDAKEEQIELERRDTYGPGYVGTEKPSGELFRNRKTELGVRKSDSRHVGEEFAQKPGSPSVNDTHSAASTTNPLDHTALNRLKAQMMKAKLRGSPDASKLEAEYETALRSAAAPTEPASIVLGAVENRMLAVGRKGEVKSVDNKRGRERGLVEENEDMSIEDMMREERRTRHQGGGESQRFAERIAKDAKFDNTLDYMDDNATKLAKRIHKSEINIKNGAIYDFEKTNRILDNCQLCHHEDTDKPPTAPIISLATRTYLTLPTEPEISEGGACIVPVQHRVNLLECDDDEWEEIRNFMKTLTRMYHDQGRDVIFYENAAVPQRKRHAAMEVVPLPYSLGETAPAFFKEAILTADEEWTQHKKLIDTLAKAKQGLGKSAFRKTLVKEMPYFHVWFQIDGGLGHIVEDSNRWPNGDLFAREIIGGMLDKGPDIIKRQGLWRQASDPRVDGFRKRWRRFDWTRVLADN